jgi:hypothetical protein
MAGQVPAMATLGLVGFAKVSSWRELVLAKAGIKKLITASLNLRSDLFV